MNLLELANKATKTRVLEYEGLSIGPHTQTTRISFSPSSNKMAYVTGIAVNIRRSTAPSTGGVAKVVAWVTCPGDIGRRAFGVLFYNTSVTGYIATSTSMPILLQKGASIDITTEDGSTGGTHDYIISAFVIEFS